MNLDKSSLAVQQAQAALNNMRSAGNSTESMQQQAEDMEDAISNLKLATRYAEEFSEQYYDVHGNVIK